MNKLKPFHVGVAAEAFAAGLFAQTGCDVSVQYGANQPEYDLLVSRADKFLKISVKGSQDGGWGLVQSHKKGRTYPDAIDHWAGRQSPKLIYCFVQFKDIKLTVCPRVYLARVSEVVTALKTARAGNGSTTLMESWTYQRGIAAGTTDELPTSWTFTSKLVSKLLRNHG